MLGLLTLFFLLNIHLSGRKLQDYSLSYLYMGLFLSEKAKDHTNNIVAILALNSLDVWGGWYMPVILALEG